MPRLIEVKLKTPTLTLSQLSDGYWLWDETRQMNLSMHASSPQEAFIETICYYQRRVTEIQKELKTLKAQVEAFVEEVHKCPDSGED